MSRNFNKVILIGHVGSDPEKRSDTVANFSLATNARWKNKKTGEYETRTDWHRITAFGPKVAPIMKHATKGKAILVEGELRTDKYTDKDSGQDRYTTYVALKTFEMLEATSGASETETEEEEAFAV